MSGGTGGGAGVRVVLTGPESCGKSVLTRALGTGTGVPFVMEYAREFLEREGAAYDRETLGRIWRESLVWQAQRIPEAAAVAVLDTDLVNFKVWYDVVFGAAPSELLEAMEREQSHVYLLCAPDIPWEPDPLRVNPNDREELFERHRAEIERLGRPWRVVRGTGTAREQNARRAMAELCAMRCGGK